MDTKEPDFAIKYTWEVKAFRHHYEVYITGEMYTCEALGTLGVPKYRPRTLLHKPKKKDLDNCTYDILQDYERYAHSFLYGYFMGCRESDLFNNNA